MIALDDRVLDWMVEHRSPGVTQFFTIVTTVGSTVAVAIATVVVAWMLVRAGHRSTGVALIIAVSASWALMNAIKFAVRRPRPPEPERIVEISTYSFPSGHAMVSAAFAAAVVTAIVRVGSRPRRTRAAAAVLTAASLLIGFSRVYLGAHWLTDVVSGWALGVLVGVAGVVLVGRRTGRAGSRWVYRSR